MGPGARNWRAGPGSEARVSGERKRAERGRARGSGQGRRKWSPGAQVSERVTGARLFLTCPRVRPATSSAARRREVRYLRRNDWLPLRGRPGRKPSANILSHCLPAVRSARIPPPSPSAVYAPRCTRAKLPRSTLASSGGGAERLALLCSSWSTMLVSRFSRLRSSSLVKRGEMSVGPEHGTTTELTRTKHVDAASSRCFQPNEANDFNSPSFAGRINFHDTADPTWCFAASTNNRPIERFVGETECTLTTHVAASQQTD